MTKKGKRHANRSYTKIFDPVNFPYEEEFYDSWSRYGWMGDDKTLIVSHSFDKHHCERCRKVARNNQRLKYLEKRRENKHGRFF